MGSLSVSQKKIIDYLNINPQGATAEALASAMGVTKTAAKQQIDQLHFLGHLTFQDEKGSVGRPKRFYYLSPEGAETLPRQYSWLSTALLKQLSYSLSPLMVRELMASIADQLSEDLEPKLARFSSQHRLGKIVEVMNDLGYRAKLVSGASKRDLVIEASNCVYHKAAKENPELCSFDIRFLEKTLGTEVRMQSCIARGGKSCRFVVKPR